MPKLPKLPKPLERNLEAIDKVPLLERKREILAGMAKEAVGGQIPRSRVGQIDPPLSTAAKLAAEIVAGGFTIAGRRRKAGKREGQEY